MDENQRDVVAALRFARFQKSSSNRRARRARGVRIVADDPDLAPRMSAEGTWDLVWARLLAAADNAGMIDWAVAVDSTIARAHQQATNITRDTGAGPNYPNLATAPPDHGIGRSRGGLTSKDPSPR